LHLPLGSVIFKDHEQSDTDRCRPRCRLARQV
jgi:hypothetical protein